MNVASLAETVEERYRRYLETTFYLRDPVLRSSFRAALRAGQLSRGPYLEATPVYRRAGTANEIFGELLGVPGEDGFLRAIQGSRPLYAHQAAAIRNASQGRNLIVATGTGSGKTEAFLLPILMHLYRECFSGVRPPGVRALVLYPMNALANDQRERLCDISRCCREAGSAFNFTFGQYIGETPEDPADSRRHARDHLAERERKGASTVHGGKVVHGELVLRSEMRDSPPHILLTNYSMLEYLLLRPDDSPLFDNGRGSSWAFVVLDEAHQYRGARGIEMAMLLRRLKQRIREGGGKRRLCCIATSATLAGGEEDKEAIARFATDLFEEPFASSDVILGQVEPIEKHGTASLASEDYRYLNRALDEETIDREKLSNLRRRLGVKSHLRCKRDQA